MGIAEHINWTDLPNDYLLPPSIVASIIGVSLKTLANWRSSGRYHLPYVKVGSKVLYKISSVRKYIADNEHSHTGMRKEIDR